MENLASMFHDLLQLIVFAKFTISNVFGVNGYASDLKYLM